MDENQMEPVPNPMSEPMPQPVPQQPMPAPKMPVPDMTPVMPPSATPTSVHGNCFSHTVGGAIGATILTAIVALGLWYYFYGMPASVPVAPIIEAPASTAPVMTDQTQIPPLSAGNTTAEISADLNQLPDTDAALSADAAAASTTISGL